MQPKWKLELARKVRVLGGKYTSGRIYNAKGVFVCYVGDVKRNSDDPQTVGTLGWWLR